MKNPFKLSAILLLVSSFAFAFSPSIVSFSNDNSYWRCYEDPKGPNVCVILDENERCLEPVNPSFFDCSGEWRILPPDTIPPIPPH
jgi:hypothetical protein